MTDQSSKGYTIWTLAAFFASLITLAGSLYLSIGMKLVACPLCFYQRTFVMGVVGVLAIGLLSGARHLSLLTLPVAVGSVGVAMFHVFLEIDGKLECPLGIAGIGTAPQQSLAALAVLLVFLLIDTLAARENLFAIVTGIVLGALFTLGAVMSAPKPADPPSKPYDAAPKICRPPYKAAS